MEFQITNDLVSYPADDSGNALAVMEVYGKWIKYTHAYGWMYWNGKYWGMDEETVTRCVIQVMKVRRIQAVKENREDVVKTTACDMWRINGCKAILKSYCTVDIEAFDSDHDVINLDNGVLHLPSMTLRSERTPDDMLTWCSPIRFNPDVDVRPWMDFLLDVVESNQDGPTQIQSINFLLECLGYSMSGRTNEEKSFYCYGPTRGGKGTLAEAMQAIFPYPTTAVTQFANLTQKRDADSQNFDLAPLKPSRVIFASESKRAAYLDTAKLKQMTGGDRVSCAFKFKDVFTYRPKFKVWMLSNWDVSMDVDDSAAWGRLIKFCFPKSYLDREDKHLKDRLMSSENLEGLLSLMVYGAHRWYSNQNGLEAPVQIKENLARARGDVDYVQHWIDGECDTRDETTWTKHSDLYARYVKWCNENGVEHRAAKGFSQALEIKGFKRLSQREDGKLARGFSGIVPYPEDYIDALNNGINHMLSGKK